jgi:signal recognition particle subunit SRP54
LIIDTAGRLHIDEDLMKELSAVRRVAEPDEVLFVADAMTGQHAVDIAMSFDEKIGISGVILTKFDSDTRGGAAISLKEITGKPIRFIGTGEKLSDLELFHPERIASRILGMGDIVSLVEKAQETINEEEALALQDKIEQSTFTLEDYLDQFRRLKKMGSIKSVLKMIPGAQDIDEDRIDEQEMRREEAIICSMTSAERKNERIIGPSRRKRIAMGSGTSVYDVNRLLKKFDKMKLTMRKMTKNKKYQAKMLSQLGGQS